MERRGQSQTQSQSQTHSSVQSNVRTKTDKAWEYTTQTLNANGNKAYICHFIMQGILKELREAGDDSGGISITIPDDERPQTQAQNVKAGKRKATSSLHPFFYKRYK